MATTPTTASAFQFAANLTWVQKELGWLVNEVESFPTVAQTPGVTQLLPQNGDRVGLFMMNGTADTIYVSINSGVSSIQGIALNPNGGSVTLKIRDDFTLITRAWWGVSYGGPGSLYILELIGMVQLPPGTAPVY